MSHYDGTIGYRGSVALLCVLAAAPAFGGARETFGEKAVLRSAAGAVYGQALRRPFEWARTAAGYGRRAGSGFAQYGVKTGIQFAVGALRREQQGYQRADETGVWKRTKHALLATLTVRRKNRTEKTVAAGGLAGAFGGGFISRLWQPARIRTVTSGFASGGIALGIDAGMNVLREFWPDLRGRKADNPGRPCAETSLGAADTSVCATSQGVSASSAVATSSHSAIN